MTKDQFKYGMLGVGILLVIILLFQNFQSISMYLFFWQVRLPAVIWFLLVFGIGVGLGYYLARKRF